MQLASVNPTRPVPASAPAGPIQATGTIAFVNTDAGFGILRPDEALRSRYAGLEHVFFAVEQLTDTPLRADMRVAFTIDPAVRDDKGYAHATGVQPA